MKKNRSFIMLFAFIATLFCYYAFTTVQTIAPQSPVSVHFIDVGQADSIFIQLPDNKNMLIDGGNDSDKNTIISYIKSKNAKNIDYVVATHMHEDHIGALDDVIYEFNIGSVYMPSTNAKTKAYDDLKQAINKKSVKTVQAKAGVSMFEESGLNAAFLAPNSDKYENENNYSAVLKLIYNNTSFLFEGDAEQLSEAEMLKSNISCNLIKVAHHGSSSSSLKNFIAKTGAKYAIISVGANNTYGHPSAKTLQTLQSFGMNIYRTDLNGTITANSNGREISISQ